MIDRIFLWSASLLYISRWEVPGYSTDISLRKKQIPGDTFMAYNVPALVPLYLALSWVHLERVEFPLLFRLVWMITVFARRDRLSVEIH